MVRCASPLTRSATRAPTACAMAISAGGPGSSSDRLRWREGVRSKCAHAVTRAFRPPTRRGRPDEKPQPNPRRPRVTAARTLRASATRGLASALTDDIGFVDVECFGDVVTRHGGAAASRASDYDYLTRVKTSTGSPASKLSGTKSFIGSPLVGSENRTEISGAPLGLGSALRNRRLP